MYNSSSNNNNDDDDDDNIIIITITIIVIVIVIGSYVFQPIALETSGPISESAVQFLNDLGRKITSVSAEVTEAHSFSDSLSLCRDLTPSCCMSHLGVTSTRTFSRPAFLTCLAFNPLHLYYRWYILVVVVIIIIVIITVLVQRLNAVLLHDYSLHLIDCTDC